MQGDIFCKWQTKFERLFCTLYYYTVENQLNTFTSVCSLYETGVLSIE